MSNVKSTIAAALSNTAPARNFITTPEAQGIAQAARADGKVTADEVAAVVDLKLEQTFFDDSPRRKDFAAPTASQPAFHELQKFLRANSLEHAVQASLSPWDAAPGAGGTHQANFVTGSEAELLVGAARADGQIDAKERAQLGALQDGWTYRDDSDATGEKSFEDPTLSMQAGLILREALKNR